MKFGQYELLERIAIGGMAEVYKGRVVGAEGFEKLVAIKRIQPDLIADERFVTMLLTEARIHSALSHRNIVQIHDLGISEEGEYFIVLEYVEGYDLRAIMESINGDGEIIPEALSLHIAAEVAQGLHFAHELSGPDRQPLGLIHRDVSPSNVLISFAGEVKLSDFGLAKRRHDRSVVGSLKGNLIYMSPEQARQAPLDRRTDVFSLGALLFELLTGKRLREITDEIKGWGEVAAGVVRSARSARPDLPPSFEALLNQALAAEPNRRFPDAATFGAAIRQLLAQMNMPVGPSDLQALLGLVRPPKRPRGELERSKVIRLVPDAARTRAGLTTSGIAPRPALGPDPSPLDRLRSAQARVSTTTPPLRRAPVPPLRAKTEATTDERPAPVERVAKGGDERARAAAERAKVAAELDEYPPTPPPVVTAHPAAPPGGATHASAPAAAPASSLASSSAPSSAPSSPPSSPPAGGSPHNTWAGGFSLPGSAPGARRRPTPLGSTLVGPAPAPTPPGVAAVSPALENRRRPLPPSVTPPGPIIARPRVPIGQAAPKGATIPAGPTVPAVQRPAAPVAWAPAPAPTTPGPTPGPTPPPRDWSAYPTPLPAPTAASASVPPAPVPPPASPPPPEMAVPDQREGAPSAPMWRSAGSARHLQPLEDPASAPRRSAGVRLPTFPIGVWRSVAVGAAAAVVVAALIVHIGFIPLEVLASWRKPAPLYVASEPEGGIAKLDGVRLIDPTPTKIPVTRDRLDHVIEVEYPGYRSVRETVRFDKSVALTFMFTLEKEGDADIAPVPADRPPLGALPSNGDLSSGR